MTTEKPLQDQFEIKNTPAVISFDFEAMKAAIEGELDKYRFVVTAETLPDAKKKATELNKTKTELDNRRKAAIAAVSAPIKEKDDQMKSLVKLIGDGRQEILDQVEKFESKTRLEIGEKIDSHLEQLFTEKGVSPEFRKAQGSDLVKLSAITAKGKLTANVRNELERRVGDDKALQDRTRMRLLELENKSYQRGLHAPLGKDHVLPFLYEDDAKYQEELERILAAELDRQDMAAKRQAEIDQRQTQAAEAPACGQGREFSDEPAEVPRTLEELEQSEPAPVASTGDKVPVSVTCTFETAVSPRVTDEAIEQEIRRIMAKAGISSLAFVSVHRDKKAAEPCAAST